jgi:hypothetical protein
MAAVSIGSAQFVQDFTFYLRLRDWHGESMQSDSHAGGARFTSNIERLMHWDLRESPAGDDPGFQAPCRRRAGPSG